MSETQTMRADERVVRTYLTALNNGQTLDALNAFSLDARFRDEAGRERRGIREIARAFATRERPLQVDIEDLENDGESVAVRLRMTYPGGQRKREYRSVFRISRNRIRSLVIDPIPAHRASRRRQGRPA